MVSTTSGESDRQRRVGGSCTCKVHSQILWQPASAKAALDLAITSVCSRLFSAQRCQSSHQLSCEPARSLLERIDAILITPAPASKSLGQEEPLSLPSLDRPWSAITALSEPFIPNL